VVYEHGKRIGRSTLSQLTIGFQAGGQEYSEVVIFKDQAALDNFKKGKLKLNAQASAIAVKARASADLAYRDGVAIVTMGKGGLMYEASVGGQKFSFEADAKSTNQ
jgi:lipid-binding SYLF domain-containing protein